MKTVAWDAALYDSKHRFVADYAADLLDLLAPRPGERVLDLGCGTGRLLAELAARGAQVVGVDADAAMVEAARARCPDLEVRLGDARELAGIEAVDAILSNATLHWVQPPEAAVRAMARVLVPGGRLVLEMGGAGCVNSVCEALPGALAQAGVPPDQVVLPWYFPSLGSYTSLLEQQGFAVTTAWLFDRPTPLEDGEAGLGNWLRMFVPQLLALAPEPRRAEVVREVESRCRSRVFRDGRWVLDYVRLRVIARRPFR